MASTKAATMGPLKLDRPDPKNFMKKHTKTAPLSKSEFISNSQTKGDTKFQREGDARKPAVPTRNEKPVMGLTTQKNFLKDNAAEAARTGIRNHIMTNKLSTQKSGTRTARFPKER